MPTELLLNSSFEKHGGLVILVGENNVGKSNILEALKAFNDTDIKLCNENDYFKAHESENTVLSLEEETSLNNETIDFSCVDLKIRYKEVSKGLKELSKTLISYPFEKHVEALSEQCSNSVYIPTNNNDHSNICTFVNNFINLIASYNLLESFLDFYKEKLKLSELVTEYANATNNLFFKELIKHVSGNSEWIKNFCQCIKEIIKHNTPDKKYNTDEFFVMGQHKQNQLAKIYSRFKELSESEPKIEVKVKEIHEKYPINENFKKQFEELESNVKHLNETKKDFERKKESWIKEIENDCKNQKTLDPNYDLLLDNIQQICKKYIASHVVRDESKDMKYMMCQFYLEEMELLLNSKIRRYQYDDLLKSARISLWEDIKTLDNESGTRLFPKNPKEIKEKFEANKEKFKQSKNHSEFAEYCRECNHYTAFQGLRNRVNFPLKDYSLDEFVPNMREYKDLKITDSVLKIKPLEDFHSQFFAHCFFQLLFNKIDFNPTTTWHSLETKWALQIKFDKNNDLEVYFGLDKSCVIPKKYLQEIDQESLKEIRRSDYTFPKCEYHNDNDMVQLTFSKDDASPLMVEVSLAEIMQLK